MNDYVACTHTYLHQRKCTTHSHTHSHTHTLTHSLTHSQRVVELSKQYLPQLSCGFSDARVKVHYRDGAEFMAEHSNEFDIIITDSSDPIGRDGGSECVYGRDGGG